MLLSEEAEKRKAVAQFIRVGRQRVTQAVRRAALLRLRATGAAVARSRCRPNVGHVCLRE